MPCDLSPASLYPCIIVLFLFVAITGAWGQIAGVSGTTSTPVPGVPHDYLGGLNEVVNPANGPLSVRVKAPVPQERGVNWRLMHSCMIPAVNML